MSDLCRLIWSAVFALFRSRAALHAEILFLRHQLNVLHRRSPKRVALSNIDRLVFAGLYCLAPQVLDALKILKPETVIRWHRAGFRAYWRWRSRPHGGRPGTPHGTRELIRDMSIANPLWGAPRIHGELLRHVNVREVVNGLMYVLSTGCQWRAIPKDLPPRSTVYDYFDLWSWDGTLDRVHHALYVKCREQAGREASPTAAIPG